MLRSLVRADPDVIMVGEIRDVETARMAADSAVTGHLVLTTVHANDAAATLYRLIEMGLPRYVVAAAFRCVVAQRLVRHLCVHCRRPATLSAEAVAGARLENGPGRAARRLRARRLRPLLRYRVSRPRRPLRGPAARRRAAVDRHRRRAGLDIRRAAAGRGIGTIRQDGIEKVLDGTTSYLEILRVTI